MGTLIDWKEFLDFILTTFGTPPPLRCVSPVKAGENGTRIVYATICSTRKKSDYYPIEIILYFDLLDMIISKRCQNPSKKSFMKKCSHFKPRNKLEIILKNIYIILIVYRNHFIHNKNSISVRNGDIVIDEKDKLSITFEKLRMLCSIIYNIYNNGVDKILNSIYAINYIISSYNNSIEGLHIKKIIDGKSICINKIESEFNIFRKNIDLYEIDSICCINGYVFFKEDHVTRKSKLSGNRIDYKISYSNNNYIIPEEALDKDRKISIENIRLWGEIAFLH